MWTSGPYFNHHFIDFQLVDPSTNKDVSNITNVVQISQSVVRVYVTGFPP